MNWDYMVYVSKGAGMLRDENNFIVLITPMLRCASLVVCNLAEVGASKLGNTNSEMDDVMSEAASKTNHLEGVFLVRAIMD